jgi:hypothetical protein
MKEVLLTLRSQLHERLQKEGVKTHKQRVEELNKYLSNLSEHHDMYVPFSPFYVLVSFRGDMLTNYTGQESDLDKIALSLQHEGELRTCAAILLLDYWECCQELALCGMHLLYGNSGSKI